MTNSTEYTVIDVGHGNCALIRDDGNNVLVDAAPRTVVTETLLASGITRLTALILSHADADHIGGAIGLLLDPALVIDHVYINSDPLRGTNIWEDFRTALRDARSRGSIEIHTQLDSGQPGVLALGSTELHVVYPTAELTVSGPGGTDLKGRPMTANSLSAVIRIVFGGRGIVLLPGDLDDVGLANVAEVAGDITADVLVFPHHGGRPGRGDPTIFTQQLLEMVSPTSVLFSIGRGRYANPNPEIVAAALSVARVRIACTQLATACSESVKALRPSHLLDAPSAGRASNSCCAGTLVIRPSEGGADVLPDAEGHLGFIRADVPTPICAGQL